MKHPPAEFDWSSASALITGATGMVGSRLVSRLLAMGAQVVCFVRDNDPASPLWFSGDVDRVSFCNGRLEAFDQVKAAVVERDVDTVFHLGAQTIVGAGRRDPLGTFESNICGTYHVLEACRLYGSNVKRIIIASSDKAYGECETLPYTEKTPLAGRHPYDVSKACADLIAQTYSGDFDLPIAITRCGNIFGPGDLNWSRLVPGTIRSLLKGQRPVVRSDGTFVRDYLYVDDAVSAYIAAAEWLSQRKALKAPRTNGAFNFSANQPMTVLAMIQLMQAACGREDLSPDILNECRGEISSQHLDSTRAHSELHWMPQWSIPAALQVTVEWYRRYLSRFEDRAQSFVLPQIPPQRTRASA